MSSRDFEEPREERTEDARRRSGELLEERDGGKPAAPLWRLFREASCGGGACRDVVEKHVISRLNQTDVKFLYDVNGETRELIKRAARSGMKLAEKFKIEEMASISTLEFALENRSLWPSEWDEKYFCKKVARTNKLELLQWIREEKKCEWDEKTSAVAAEQGNLEMVKYCVANQCAIDAFSCSNAAENGHLKCLKYLHEDVKAPWDCETANLAALNGHLHILEYLVEREYDKFDKSACSLAAEYGHLECLKYLHEEVKAPWDCEAVRMAREFNHSECLQYLLDNDCPLPEGWRYEDRKLRAALQFIYSRGAHEQTH